MCETIELDMEPIKTNTVQAACVFCSAENDMVEKLFPGQTYWQVDQICMTCGERLRNLAWRQYEPDQIGLEGLEQMTVTFKIICEPKEAERLGWLSNDRGMKLNKAILRDLL